MRNIAMIAGTNIIAFFATLSLASRWALALILVVSFLGRFVVMSEPDYGTSIVTEVSSEQLPLRHFQAIERPKMHTLSEVLAQIT